MNINLTLENEKHESLKKSLHDLLSGKTPSPSLYCYHYDCSLGQWLYSDGILKYRELPEIHQLERIHAEMHYNIISFVEKSKEGKTTQSINTLNKIDEISKQMSLLLNTVQEKIAGLNTEQKQGVRSLCEHSRELNAAMAEMNADLVKEHQTLFDFFMQAPGLFCVLKGKSHTFELINPYYKQIIGERELKGKEIREAMPELKGQGVFELLDKVYHRQRAYQGKEIPIYFDKGKGIPEKSYVNFIYKPILNRKNETEGILVFGYDVSEQVKLRKCSEENEARLKLAMDTAEMGSFEWDMNSKEFIYSKQLLKIYGLKKNQVITHKYFANAIHPEDQKIRVHAIEEAIHTGKLFYEARILRPDRHVRWIKFSGKIIFDKKRNPLKMYGAALDVTDQKTLEERLEKKVKERTKELVSKNEMLLQQKELSDNVINSSLDSIAVLDTKLRFVILNSQAQRSFKKKREDLIGKQIHKVFPSLLRSDFYRDLKKTLKGETIRDANYRLSILKGYFEITMIPLKDSNNKVYGVLTIAHDNTLIVEASNRLITANKKLEEKNIILEKNNRELESFRYIANHDLQEPLRKIRIFSGLIKKNMEDQKKIKEYIEHIIYSSGSMSDLIHAVLNFSRLSKNEEYFTEVDLGAVLDEVLLELKPVIEEKRVQIRHGNLLSVKGGREQLKQLFKCIISNSLKFSEKRPVVNISSKIITRETIVNNQSQTDKYLELTLKDNGIGFEQKYADQIFKMFKRLQTSHMFPGAGIGLAMVKKIIENHKGHIFVKSEPAKGTTFYIYLPVL